MRSKLVYALIDPFDNEIKYIGSTFDLPERIKGHFSHAKRKCYPIHYWILSLEDQGISPAQRVLAYNVPQRNATKVERKFIMIHKPIYNHSLTEIPTYRISNKKTIPQRWRDYTKEQKKYRAKIIASFIN